VGQGSKFSQRNLLISSSLKVNFLRLSSQNSSQFEPVFEYGIFSNTFILPHVSDFRRGRTIAKSEY
jgi:hypothetical protein